MMMMVMMRMHDDDKDDDDDGFPSLISRARRMKCKQCIRILLLLCNKISCC